MVLAESLGGGPSISAPLESSRFGDADGSARFIDRVMPVGKAAGDAGAPVAQSPPRSNRKPSSDASLSSRPAFHQTLMIRADVPNADVIAHNDDDVGLCPRLGGGWPAAKQLYTGSQS